MSKGILLGAVAAGALAMATFTTSGPASASVRFSVYAGPTYTYAPPRRSCWHWSYRLGEWVNFCRAYSYRYSYPRYAPVYPYNPYAYSYGYGPYAYDYGPSYSVGPSFGFSFGFGGGH